MHARMLRCVALVAVVVALVAAGCTVAPLAMSPALVSEAGAEAAQAAELEKNKALVHDVMSEFNKGNYQYLVDMSTADYVYHDPVSPMVTTREEHAAFLEGMHEVYPDLVWTINELVAEDDLVAMHWSARGTHQGQIMGVSPTGNEVEASGISIWRVQDGALAGHSNVWDYFTMLSQLGFTMSPPAQPGAPAPAYGMRLEHLAEVVGYVTVVPVGPSSWGVRIIAPLVGGSVEGPRLSGKVLPVGGDFGVIRADNCFELDVRVVIETDDGAMIYAAYHGVSALTEEQVADFMAGMIPEGLILYVTPRFETAHPNYQWLTHVQAVGVGSLEPEGDLLKVTYSWYVLTSDAVADLVRGAIQFRGGFATLEHAVLGEQPAYIEGLFSVVVEDNLPGGRQRIHNPDGWWAKIDTGNTAVDGWYVFEMGGAIRQPDGVIQLWGTWNHWVDVPVDSLADWFFVELPKERDGDGWVEGWWSGTFSAIIEEERPFAEPEPEFTWENFPKYGNMSFAVQGIGVDVDDQGIDRVGWAITMDAQMKDGDVAGATFSGHITPPRPGGRPR